MTKKYTKDATFKTIFKDEAIRPWFNQEIKDICGIDISDYELEDGELNEIKSKDFRTDIFLSNPQSDKVIIEMQNTKADRKNYLYLQRVAGKNIKKGEDAEEEERMNILIQFKNYPVKGANGDILMHFKFMDPEHPEAERIKTESYEIILSNLKKKDYTKLKEAERKLFLLISENIEEMKKYALDETDKKLVKRMEELEMNLEDIFLDPETERALDRKDARDQGYEEGFDEGIIKEKEEMVIRMLEANQPDEFILEITQIDENTFKEIKDNYKKD